MSSIIQRLKQNSILKGADVLSKSTHFDTSNAVSTPYPALNIILSGKPDGGFNKGLIIIGAPRAHFKTSIGLKMIKAYLDKYEDGVCIFYDSEYGGSMDYMTSHGIDTDRVLHSPIDSIESLKFDIVRQLDEIEPNEHVIFFIDSIGMLASNKEATDALNQKVVGDMTKAKELASLARLITPKLNAKGLTCIAINHVYKDISSMYGGTINSGGEKLQYAANIIIQITKSQEKEGKELLGFSFRLVADKSRFIREKTAIPLVVTFDGGIQKWSGMFDLAIQLQWIVAPKQGWYQAVNPHTNTPFFEGNKRRKELENDDEFWNELLTAGFSDDIQKHFSLTSSTIEV